jgi:hypothetical protein
VPYLQRLWEAMVNSEILDRVDWAGAVRRVLDRHPDVVVNDAAVAELATEMHEACQMVFRASVKGMQRSIDKHVALGVIRAPSQ